MDRGIGRADDLAGGLLAMDAGDRLVHHLGLLGIAREIAVDPDPVQLAAAGNLVLAHERDVVLALAGQHAGAATRAGVEVDGHAPLVLALVDWDCLDIGQLFLMVAAARGLRRQVGERELANQVAALHRVVFLGRGQARPATGRRDLQAGGDIRRLGGTQGIGVVANVLADVAACGPAVAESHADRVIGLAGEQHGRNFQAPAVKLQADHVAIDHAQLAGRLRAQQRGVAPGELGDRVRELLEPAVVGVAAVIDLGVALKDQLQVRALDGAAGPDPAAVRACATLSHFSSGRSRAYAPAGEVPSWRNIRQAASNSASLTPLILRNDRRTIS